MEAPVLPAPCPPCTEPHVPASAVMVAVVVVLAVVLVYWLLGRLGGHHKDRFVSSQARDLYAASRGLLDRTGGRATYSEFKTRVAGADPVTYTDMRRLWTEGKLSPEAVQATL